MRPLWRPANNHGNSHVFDEPWKHQFSAILRTAENNMLTHALAFCLYVKYSRSGNHTTTFTSLHTDKLIYNNITNIFWLRYNLLSNYLLFFNIYFYFWLSTYCFCQFYINNRKNYIKSQTKPTAERGF